VSAEPAGRYQRSLISDLDAPVQRFFNHAIRGGTALHGGMRLTMTGRIKVGTWLPFTAEQIADGRSFAWRARVGWGPITPLRVLDRYADGAGTTEGRLLGRLTLFHADDLDTTRSSAARAAMESFVFAPHSVLPNRGVAWRAETEDIIVARFDLPPELPRSARASTSRGASERSAPCAGGMPARRRSSTSPSEARSTLNAASATSCSPAISPSAGGSTRRATRRSSKPTSTTAASTERRRAWTPGGFSQAAAPFHACDSALRRATAD
jgi:hypothetical protein